MSKLKTIMLYIGVNVMEVKDYRYIIGILVWTIVGVFTFHYGGKDSEIVSYIGFAGTVSSIILALLTIIYSYYQNSAAISGVRKIKKTSEEIVGTAERFNEVFNKFELAQKEIAASLTCVNDIKDDVSRGMANLSEKLSGMVPIQDSKDDSSVIITKEMISNSFQFISSWGLQALKICICESKKPSNKTLAKIMEEFTQKTDGINLYNYYWGFIVAYNCSGLIKITMNDNIFVAKIDKNFEETFDEFIATAIHNKRFGKSTESLVKNLNIIRQMYQ